MNDFRVEIRVKNSHLYNAIMGKYKSVAEFSRLSGFNQGLVGRLLNLKETPLSTDGLGFKDSSKQLADYLGYLPDELFPDSIKEIKLSNNYGFFEIEANRLDSLMHTRDPLDILTDECGNNLIHDVIETLTLREQKVIKMRFGIDYEKGYTLKEVGDEFGVSAGRIRELEAKALRKMRHPTKHRTLKHLINEDADNETFLTNERYEEKMKGSS